MNIRIKFGKYGVMRFVGHLDVMRYFQKAMRRANIDIAYSEGYSPHQIMSFAAPLGVGVTSDGEYFDIEVNTSSSSQEAMEALNKVMVEGISILEYKQLPDTAKTSMSLVAAADYLVCPKPGCRPFAETLLELQEKVHAFYEGQSEICITKQTKKREIQMDLKPLIYQMKASGKDGNPSLFLRVSTGSNDNVKPELVLEAFCHFHGISYDALAFQVHRLEVYAKADEIPVKGEKERKAYEAFLVKQRQSYQKEGKEFPQFLPLGELGWDIK